MFDLPEIPTPTEILVELVTYLGELVINHLVAWLGGLVAPIVAWVTVHWSLGNPGGLLGGLLETLFQFSLGVAGGFIVVAIMLAFVQRWLMTLFPNLSPLISLSQLLGRLLVITVVLALSVRTELARLIDGTSAMALSFAGGSISLSGPSAGEWSWLPNLINLVLTNPQAIEFFGLGIILIGLTALTLFGALLVKQLGAVLLLGALPLAATAWLYALTEGIWAKYWWLLIKLTALPIILAFFLRVIVLILTTVATSSFLVAALLIGVVQIAGLYVGFKFLTFSLGKVLSHPTVVTTLGAAGGVSLISQGQMAAGASTLASTLGGRESRRAVSAIRRLESIRQAKPASAVEHD